MSEPVPPPLTPPLPQRLLAEFVGTLLLVCAQRSGRHIHYRAELERMNALLSYLSENCCQGQGCLAPSNLLCTLPEPQHD